jgi:gas vesicle protein
MQRAVNLDDSAIGGQPGEYTRVRWCFGVFVGAAGTVMTALKIAFNSGKEYQELKDLLAKVNDRMTTQNGRLDTIETVQAHRADLYNGVAEDVAELKGEMKIVSRMVTGICHNTNTPISGMRTPSPDELAELYRPSQVHP